ncbi:gamma-mobile-trio protein GmtX [Paraburkholderia sp. J94]|uniref:gamma-mobile-trio protein GmtX n=1 Tax=Paraburkholderia sp. J94 TaxID=2805441 RepID=UPI002AB2DECF|nr:gamma-mobile-trio protein GmtX [Paraburkholderia sp. J94]
MNSMTDIHPDAVIESLLTKGARSNRRANLARLHDVCRRQYESGSRDFSLPAIGRAVEAEKIMKGRILYNAQSADYRALIEAWGAFSGPPSPKPPKTLATHDYLLRIDDPAIRSIMQAVIVERDKLKAQLNILKANAQVTVDRRPQSRPIEAATSGTQPVTVIAMAAQLTPSEHDALKKAVDSDYLDERGLKEGSHGEIVSERGRTIFEVGFALAIRKVLGE